MQMDRWKSFGEWNEVNHVDKVTHGGRIESFAKWNEVDKVNMVNKWNMGTNRDKVDEVDKTVCKPTGSETKLA